VNVIAIGAHPDDIELGCGGALLRHVARGDHVTMLVMTTGQRGVTTSSRVFEQQDAARVIGASLRWGNFEDGSIPRGAPTIAVIDEAIAATDAHVLYTHAPRDSHQDHRAVAVASLAAARRMRALLYYETPSTQRFEPTVYVDIAEVLDDKLRALCAHESQVMRDGSVNLEALDATARFRGSQGRIRHAEAFESPRLVWDLKTTPLSDTRALSTERLKELQHEL
jgi:LmbE family N-acetylglucosaminyl deacetylase